MNMVIKNKKVLHEWAQRTTFHGISDVDESESIFKAFCWIFLIAVCCSLAIFQIYGLFQGFLTPPHYQTIIYTKDDPVLIFPNITICNFNRANLTKTKELGLNSDAVSFLYNVMITSSDIDSKGIYGSAPLDLSLTDPRLQKLLKIKPYLKDLAKTQYEYNTYGNTSSDYYYDYVESKNFTLNQGLQAIHYLAWKQWYNNNSVPNEFKDIDYLLRYLGHSCENTFVQCRWVTNEFDCCKDAKPVLSNEYGLCWSLNLPRKGTELFKSLGIDVGDYPAQAVPGSFTGLKVLIDPNIDQYQSTTIFNDYLESGVVLLATFTPFSHMQENPMLIAAGSHARVALKKSEKYVKLPRVKLYTPNCYEDGTLWYGKEQYSSSGCVYECFLESAIQRCDCMLVGEYKRKPKKTCLPEQMLTCFYPNILLESLKMNSSFHAIKCASECSETCNKRYLIETSVTYSKYVSKEKLQHLTNLLALMDEVEDGDEQRVSSSIQLDIFYPIGKVTVEEKRMITSPFELIGNVGGQLGLWLGASILTLIQAVLYLFYGCKVHLRKRKIVNQSTNLSQKNESGNESANKEKESEILNQEIESRNLEENFESARTPSRRSIYS